MKLFPATASPAALESLASHAYDAWRTGPTIREQRQMDADERRDERCRQLAEDAFERCADLDVHEWLAREENHADLVALAVASIRGDDDLRRVTLQELGERFLDQRAGEYMRDVLDEELLAEEQDAQEEDDRAEEAAADAADQWWEQTHG